MSFQRELVDEIVKWLVRGAMAVAAVGISWVGNRVMKIEEIDKRMIRVEVNIDSMAKSIGNIETYMIGRPRKYDRKGESKWDER